MDLSELVNFFISLFIICNPLAALPALLRLTQDQTLEQKRKTGITTAFSVAIILIIVTWVGGPILQLLSIRIPAFQVAGGLIILIMALSMLNAKQSRMKQTLAEEEEAIDQRSVAIIPLAMPLIAGPGAMSMIIVHTHEYPHIENTIYLSICAFLVALAMGIILYFANSLERLLGKVGINVFNRLGGLLLAAIAIESLATGIAGLFPFLNK